MSPNLFCPGCGHGLPAGVAFCPACGNAVPGGAPRYEPNQAQPYRWMETPAPPRPVVPLETAPPAYSPPTVRQDHFPCPGCGMAVSRAASFCPQCGRGLTPQNAPTARDLPPPQQAAFAQPAPTLSFAQRSPGEQLLIVILALIAACVILAFFC